MKSLLYFLCLLARVGASLEYIENAGELAELIGEEDFVLVLWSPSSSSSGGSRSSNCERAEASADAAEDELEDMGVALAVVADRKQAKKHGVKTFPSLTLFRGGTPLHLLHVNPTDPKAALRALRARGVLELSGKPRKVEADELARMTEGDGNVVAFFQAKDDEDHEQLVLAHLDDIARELKPFQMEFVRVRSADLAEEFLLTDILPALVFFR